jgi:hypothetical protein
MAFGETKGAVHTGYLWAYHSPPDQLIFYDFRPDEGRRVRFFYLRIIAGICKPMAMVYMNMLL